MTPFSRRVGRAAQGARRVEILTLVLEATIKGACRPPHQSDLRALGTNEYPGYGRRHPQSFIPKGGPRQGAIPV